jgi:hypothetical protein
MKVFRVEHPETKFGPYWVGPEYIDLPKFKHLSDLSDAIRKAHWTLDHPSVETDIINIDDCPPLSHVRCGFDSLEKLQWWFKGHTQSLHDCGYRILVFEVHEFMVLKCKSDKQIVFYRPETHIEELSLI